MKISIRTKNAVLLVSLLAVAFAVNAAGSKSISASGDPNGSQHPGTAAIKGPATITCTSASQSVSSGGQRPSCFITAPGAGGVVDIGKQVGSSGAGTVTLTCNGQGALRCSARIDE
jgi:hypothetical protein